LVPCWLICWISH